MAKRSSNNPLLRGVYAGITGTLVTVAAAIALIGNSLGLFDRISSNGNLDSSESTTPSLETVDADQAPANFGMYGRSEIYEALMDDVKSAERSIEIISALDLTVVDSDTPREIYYMTIQQWVEEHPTLKYRRLLWLPSHLTAVLDWDEDLLNAKNLELRYLPHDVTWTIPRIPVAVFDRKTAWFATNYLGGRDKDQVGARFTDSRMAPSFADYFGTLWNHEAAIELKKAGEHVDRSTLRSLSHLVSSDETLVNALARVADGARPMNQVVEHLLANYERAISTIDVICTVDLRSSGESAEQFIDGLSDIFKSNPAMVYRRIIWDASQFQAVLEWLAQPDCPTENSAFAFLAQENGQEAPLVSCAIIDDRVVLLGLGLPGPNSMEYENITIHSDDIGAFVQRYFQRLWDSAVVFKHTGGAIDNVAVSEIRRRIDQETGGR